MTRCKYVLFVVIFHFLNIGCVNSQDFVIFKAQKSIPILYIENENLRPWANDFNTLFNRATGVFLSIKVSRLSEVSKGIFISKSTKANYFEIEFSDQKLILNASDLENIRKANRRFFVDNVNLYSKDIQKLITININYKFISNEPFEYKEPYFNKNFSKDFREWNNTNTLEETWALWGHNIGKFIKVTPKMYAFVDGEYSEEQLNFSSKELFDSLSEKISESLNNGSTINKFMIMPYDNDLVCQCDDCLKMGNTQTNASPAVFTLINRLAEKFPKANFYSTAYSSTIEPPKFELRNNVGVMISTMSFPKGIDYKNSNKYDKINELITGWKKTSSQIYLWDYAINFDNYFEFYPTIAIAQQNYKLFKDYGVKGVFMHGSDEGGYAAFDDLKCYLYAQLFNNLDINLDKLAKDYLNNKYPDIGNSLAEIYNEMELSALNSNKQLDVYGGIHSSVKKYLNIGQLNKLLSVIDKSKSNNIQLQKLKLAVLFQQLELMRYYGVSNEGYADLKSDGEIVLKSNVITKLNQLEELSQKTNITTINESGFLIKPYIAQWRKKITTFNSRNLFLDKKIKSLTPLDEDYTNLKVLNNGSLGFDDYYNNWLISTLKPNLELEFSTEGLHGAKKIILSLLKDEKHKIYLPKEISITIGKTKFNKVLKQDNKSKREVIEVEIPIDMIKEGNNINVNFVKQNQYANKAIACNGIIFR